MGLLSKREGLDASQRSWVTGKLSYLTAAEVPRPTFDLDRLDTGEQQELSALVFAACDGQKMPDPARIPKQRQRLAQLTAKASGKPSDHYEKQARDAKAAAKTAAAEAKSRRLPLSRAEERNFFLVMAEALRVGDLWLDDVAVLVGLLGQFAAGVPFSSSSRFEGVGRDAALVINTNLGIWGGVDGEQRFANSISRIGFMGEEGWLQVSRRGPEMTIKLGKMLFELLDGEPYLSPPAPLEPVRIG